MENPIAIPKIMGVQERLNGISKTFLCKQRWEYIIFNKLTAWLVDYIFFLIKGEILQSATH